MWQRARYVVILRCLRKIAVIGVAALLACAGSGIASEPPSFADEAQRERYIALLDELRCPQCQNQNLMDSDAPLAGDLRDTVYRMLQEGKSDREITRYLIDRYGDFITYMPQFKRTTYALWLTPFILALFAVVLVWLILRRQRRQPEENVLSGLEREKLDKLLNETDNGNPKS